MLTSILLSAGESSRFGTPKALALIDGTPVIAKILNLLLSSPIDKIIVVLGAHAEKIGPFLLHHKKINIVHNKHYNFGQTSSFQCGLATDDDSIGTMLFPVDLPFVQKETIQKLIAVFNEKGPPLLVPTFNGRKGHPPIFHRRLRDAVLGLPANEKLHRIIHDYATDDCLLPVDDDGVLATFNTKEEFRELIKKYGGK
jgi:molybdenum cofactor cytidylyltransferase